MLSLLKIFFIKIKKKKKYLFLKILILRLGSLCIFSEIYLYSKNYNDINFIDFYFYIKLSIFIIYFENNAGPYSEISWIKSYIKINY